MHPTRRHVLSSGAAAAAGLGLARAAAALPGAEDRGANEPRLDRAPTLLILGGTRFVGPALVDAARARGFEVTLFNRGRSAPELFPDLEQLRGDRDPAVGDGLSALGGERTWDAVIDTSGYVPRIVQASAEMLTERVQRYVFISSISTYADDAAKGLTEADAVGRLDDPTVERVTGATYGPLKALCEEAVEAACPERTLTLRPGLIVGPGDTTGRFGYYPLRVREGGRMLAPGAPDDPVQFIDARDLAEFALRGIVDGLAGTYNTVGPTYGCTIAELLYGCRALTSVGTDFTWVDAATLATHELGQRRRIPMWSDPAGPLAKFNHMSGAKAIAAGLSSRPLAATAGDFLAWFDAQPAEQHERLRGGLSPADESAVLEA